MRHNPIVPPSVSEIRAEEATRTDERVVLDWQAASIGYLAQWMNPELFFIALKMGADLAGSNTLPMGGWSIRERAAHAAWVKHACVVCNQACCKPENRNTLNGLTVEEVIHDRFS